MTTFTGIPREGLQFLADVAENNNKPWFEDHRETYKHKLLTPAQALVAALGAELQAVAPGVNFDTRANGAGSLYRIYRDTRFSDDKSPYKNHQDMIFWQGPSKKLDSPSFGVRITATGVDLLAGLYRFDKPGLEKYRAAVDAETSGRELVELAAELAAAGIPVQGQHYKRVPRGYDADHPRAELLKHNGLFVSPGSIPVEVVTTPGLVQACMDRFMPALPLHAWLVRTLSV